MPSFSQAALTRSLTEYEGDEYEQYEGEPEVPCFPVLDQGQTDESWEDGLVEGHWMVFEVEGKFYRAEYRRMCRHYMSEVGEECDPFNTDPVECQRMKAVTSVKYVPDE